ncbi:uncharacterized protein EDB91DRAFT_48354 [Suillus paluster]|uniref:uncharacterized protein n=1 Tax=Suillus paluster TaxID=48578 RepID=UPI001B86244A|nr:uncharacterized protein EDB91DRAFT_48354 [Suillus paluster]KAG1747863.1 hypothetical protein EDB91DRAFT_48354 [Suillus paluster]
MSIRYTSLRWVLSFYSGVLLCFPPCASFNDVQILFDCSDLHIVLPNITSPLPSQIHLILPSLPLSQYSTNPLSFPSLQLTPSTQIRIAYEWTEDSVIKYLWSAAGYGLIAVPLIITRKHHRSRVADGEDKGGEIGEGWEQKDADRVVVARMETYTSNRRLLSLPDSGGRLMYAYKDLQEVAGLTGRHRRRRS